MKKLIYFFLWVITWSGCQRENHQHMEQMEEDSLNIPVLSPTSTKQDSLNWYGYQVYQKHKSGEADSAIHYGPRGIVRGGQMPLPNQRQ